MKITVELVLFALFATSFGKYNKKIYLPSSTYCRSSGTPRSSTIEIDGAEISSTSRTGRQRCVIHFKGDASNSDMYVKVVRWKGGNNKDLTISYGSVVSATFNRLSAYNRFVRVSGRYVTINYNIQTYTGYNDFEIVVTAVEKGVWCDEFSCNNGRCIDKDLKCDTVDHCFDGSDEKCSTFAKDITGTVVKVATGVIVGISVGVVLICILIVVCVVVCCRRSRGSRGTVIRNNQSAVTVTTAAPGSYPAQPSGYAMQPAGYQPNQPSYAYPAAQPGYPPPQPNSPAPTPYAYGQGTGFTSTDTQNKDLNAPPSYVEATAPPTR